MASTDTCPLCRGEGRLKFGQIAPARSGEMGRTCHGCGGKGWVALHEIYPLVPRPVFGAPQRHRPWRLG
jgi:hypothetical protein